MSADQPGTKPSTTRVILTPQGGLGEDIRKSGRQVEGAYTGLAMAAPCG